jgi:hypothetical protein
MSTLRRNWVAGALGFLLLTVLYGCAVTGGGYDGDVGVSYGVGFYEPYGYDYGGWGRGYHVGPPRGGERRPEPSSHPYRQAPASHPTPSIPTRSRRH